MSSRYTSVVLALLLLLGFSRSLGWADPIAIRGIVLLPDGNPAGGARVVYPSQDPSGFVVGQTLTDKAGRFALTMEARAGEAVSVMLPGYPLAIAQTKPGQELTIHLSGVPIALSGTVTDSDGKPLPGVQVGVNFVRAPLPSFAAVLLADQHAYLLQAVTDAQGRFSLPDLAAGQEVRLNLMAPGRARVSREIPAGQPGLKLVLPPEATITGRVTRDGEPVPKIRVHCWNQNSAGEAVTAADGVYRIDGLAAGETGLEVQEPPEGLVGPVRALFALHAGDHLTGYDFALTPGALISGKVTAADHGQQVAAASVNAEVSVGGKWVASYWAKAGPDGSYQLRLPANECVLKAAGTSAAGGEWEGVPDHLKVETHDGDRKTGVDFVLNPPPEVRGVALLPDGRPAAGARVTLLRGLWARSQQNDTVADAAGRFRFVIDPFSVHDREGHEREGTVAALAPGCALTWVAVPINHTATIRLNGHPVALAGTITDAAGRGVAGAQIAVTDLGTDERDKGLEIGPDWLQATSGPDGRFSIPGVPPGIRVGYFITTPGYADVTGGTAAGLPVMRFPLAPEAVVEGRVMFNGQGVPGVYVVCEQDPNRPGHIGPAPTAADGSYRFDRLAAGEVSLWVWRGGPEETVAPLSMPLELKVGEHVTGHDLVFSVGAVLSGKVTEAVTGKPVAGASVWVDLEKAAPPTETGAAHPVAEPLRAGTVQTDATGTYQLRVPPGRYKVTAAAPDSAIVPRTRPVEVTDGDRKSGLDFALTPPPQIHGRVLLPDGKPAVGATVFTNNRTYEFGGGETNEFAATTAADGSFAIGIEQSGNPDFAPGERQTAIMALLPAAGLAGWVKITDLEQPMEIHLARGAYVTGKVVDMTGRPVAGLQFQLNWSEPGQRRPLQYLFGTTNALGQYRFGPLPAETLELNLSEPENESITDESWQYDNGLRMKLRAGQTEELPLMHLNRQGRSAALRVVDAQGKPVAGALVMAKVMTRDQVFYADGRGSLVITGLPVHGEVWIGVKHPGQPLYDVRLVDPDQPGVTRFVVRPLGSLSGQLVDEQGRPVTDRQVLAQPDQQRIGWGGIEIWALVHCLQVAATASDRGPRPEGEPGATPDGHGRWKLDDLPSGISYSLLAMREDGWMPLRPDSRVFLVRPGETTDVGQVVLNPPPTHPRPASSH